MTYTQGSRTIWLVAFTVACCALPGCKKPPAVAAPEPVAIAIPGSDLNDDGTIGERGMQKLQAAANGAGLSISFVRSRLSDDGLVQLAEAIDSRITPEGIARLKAAIPGVEVVK